MHAIRDRMDVVIREHLLRHFAVLHGHTVDVARKTQRQVGHVQQGVVQAAEALNRVATFRPKNRVHLVQPELVVACRHRCMRSEDATMGNFRQIFFGRVLQRLAVEVFF